jgi:hypothetical protein
VSSAYLIDHPPVRQQFYKTRSRALTGCTVLHTAESVMDSVGPDTGAENVAEFIRTRSTPGSYHDLVDSDSVVTLVPYESGAFHDGTGSNNWALSISFACATSDWRRMTPQKRKAFLRNGALAFKRQQDYRRSIGAPLTELRHITKAQSDAGQSGFCFHGDRDPGRRTDPGVAAPNLFPFDEFITECRSVMADTPPITEDEDDMAKYPLFLQAPDRPIALVWPGFVHVIANDEELAHATSRFGDFEPVGTRQWDVDVSLHVNVAMSRQAVEEIAAEVAETTKAAGNA